MKLKNKKTGEIGYLLAGKTSDNYFITNDEWDRCGVYDSLAELNAEWEDAPEELKEYWYIDADGEVLCEPSDNRCEFDNNCREIGNYFETREEAEKAVEKLMAWKRLKDKGLRFGGHDDRDRGQLGDIVFYAEMPAEWICCNAVQEDLNLLFSGGEE